jgi:hypothetical protein
VATAAARADGPDAEATQFLEQVALVSSEETPFEDALLVVDGVKQWLAVQPDDPNSVSRENFGRFDPCTLPCVLLRIRSCAVPHTSTFRPHTVASLPTYLAQG